jgi:hypothetical protein
MATVTGGLFLLKKEGMQQDRYEFGLGKEENMYEFFSEGPKGKIKKAVSFQKFSWVSGATYNLTFGDWDVARGRINDLSISNNNDRSKILTTVAIIVITFLEEHLNAIVFATGSTRSRTRLYQMGIASFIEEITIRFEVRGYLRDNWELFQRGQNYSSFFIRWRNL